MGGFLSVSGLSVGYGRTSVLRSVELSIEKGEFVALLGSSGCGKTTLLRAIAGFTAPSAGSISVAGREVSALGPEKRGMAMVFQSYALWPHMTVAQNIGYGLKLRRLPRAEIAERVAAMEAMLGLTGLSARKPAALSGGQRQRVALGRALAVDPEILLLDEPLSNLDARIRLSVRHEIRALQRRLGITAIHVTHDREEAMVMADRIVILNAGETEQQGTPEEVYNRPRSAFVAAFMGAENVVRLTALAADASRLLLASSPVNPDFAGRPRDYDIMPGPVEVRFRPEAATLLPAADAIAGPADALDLAGSVSGVAYPGGSWRHVIALRNGTEVLVDAPRAFDPGDPVIVRIPDDRFYVFGAASAPDPSGPAAHAGRVRQNSAIEPNPNLEINQ